MSATYLVRYGSVPEVARFVSQAEFPPERGERVVVRTHRGLQLGTVLERISKPAADDDETEFEIIGPTSAEDELAARMLQQRCESEFYDWCRRILMWNLPLELIDLEWTLDSEKLILYVLAERGPATTQLALQAAAEGLGIIEVQPVASTGLVAASSGGGCGSGGCGCH